MKKKFVLSTCVLELLLFQISCDQKDEDQLILENDQQALEGMREAYLDAVDENSSFQVALGSNDTELIQMHDSIFHHEADLFEEYHDLYSHHNNHDDHMHDSNGMHMMGNSGMMHEAWSDGHHRADHEEMEDLMDDHENSVPEDFPHYTDHFSDH